MKKKCIISINLFYLKYFVVNVSFSGEIMEQDHLLEGMISDCQLGFMKGQLYLTNLVSFCDGIIALREGHLPRLVQNVWQCLWAGLWATTSRGWYPYTWQSVWNQMIFSNFNPKHCLWYFHGKIFFQFSCVL